MPGKYRMNILRVTFQATYSPDSVEQVAACGRRGMPVTDFFSGSAGKRPIRAAFVPVRRHISACGLHGMASMLRQQLERKELKTMKVMIDLCIVPVGVGVSLSPYVAACEKVLAGTGLKTSLHSFGTNVEGEWDEVFAAVKKCHEVLHEMGAPRITATIKVGTRIDREQSLEDKVRSVREKL